MREEDILHENGKYWVCKAQQKGKKGYEIYKVSTTHSVRCGQVGVEGEKGLQIAITECDKRA